MMHFKRSFTQGLVTGILLASFGSFPVLAQSVLTRAEIYKKRNQVELERQNQGVWNPAVTGDVLVPGDAVRTAARSRAELLFNEGTLVRTAAGTIFRFPPGKRRFELVSGAALIMIRPGMGISTITTPQAQVVSHGTALFLQHDASRNASLIGVLTNSPAGPVQVINQAGEVVVELQAGQFVSIVNGIVGLAEHFILPMFYDSIDLAVGLGSEQEDLVAQESPQVQTTINAVRDEALPPLQAQINWLQGFCEFNPLSTIELSALVQWLWPAAVSPEGTLVQLPKGDILMTPFGSLSGLLWLENYCQSSSTQSSLEPHR